MPAAHRVALKVLKESAVAENINGCQCDGASYSLSCHFMNIPEVVEEHINVSRKAASQTRQQSSVLSLAVSGLLIALLANICHHLQLLICIMLPARAQWNSAQWNSA
jgi:hypothetical protein